MDMTIDDICRELATFFEPLEDFGDDVSPKLFWAWDEKSKGYALAMNADEFGAAALERAFVEWVRKNKSSPEVEVDFNYQEDGVACAVSWMPAESDTDVSNDVVPITTRSPRSIFFREAIGETREEALVRAVYEVVRMEDERNEERRSP